ncbi:MAG: alpha/beta hydrolase [Victivallales bacterium]|nr:alpha/beta hydrolase [Victivallales bacterium]
MKIAEFNELAVFPEGKKYYLWPDGKMPDAQPHQIAATTEEANAEGFKPGDNRIAYIQWFRSPEENVRTDACMIIISGGGYNNCCDMKAFAPFVGRLLAAGINCVNFIYRTPRSAILPIYKTAWEDGQRAVRMVRSQAAEHGFSPEKIGVVGCSAGSHLCMLLALSSQTTTYKPIDELDEIPCNVAWSIPMCPAYVLSDGLLTPNEKGGHGDDVVLDEAFAFDSNSCPCCFMHGGLDQYSPMGSVKAYRRLRQMGITTELHLEAKAAHGFANYNRLDTPQVALDFLKRIGVIPTHNSLEADMAAIAKWEKDRLAGCQGNLDLL